MNAPEPRPGASRYVFDFSDEGSLARALPYSPPPAAPKRASGSRAGRGAVGRRRALGRRARYAAFMRSVLVLTAVTVSIVFYLALMANVTRLSYELARTAQEKAGLVDETARLDDQIARLESRERLTALAHRLGMHDPRAFISIAAPTDDRAQAAHGLALLNWLR